MKKFYLKWLWWNVMVMTGVSAGPVSAEHLAGSALVSALRHGGYVLVLHHASSPFQKLDKATADHDNVNMERQLDSVGKQTSMAMGKAIKTLNIPIGDVESSETYRAMQTAKYAELNNAKPVSELTEGNQGMAADTDKNRAAWLKHAVTIAPRAGANTVLITHTPNMMAAFGAEAQGVKAGESMVFHPDGKGGTALVVRIKSDEWLQLAAMQH